MALVSVGSGVDDSCSCDRGLSRSWTRDAWRMFLDGNVSAVPGVVSDVLLQLASCVMSARFRMLGVACAVSLPACLCSFACASSLVFSMHVTCCPRLSLTVSGCSCSVACFACSCLLPLLFPGRFLVHYPCFGCWSTVRLPFTLCWIPGGRSLGPTYFLWSLPSSLPVQSFSLCCVFVCGRLRGALVWVSAALSLECLLISSTLLPRGCVSPPSGSSSRCSPHRCRRSLLKSSRTLRSCRWLALVSCHGFLVFCLTVVVACRDLSLASPIGPVSRSFPHAVCSWCQRFPWPSVSASVVSSSYAYRLLEGFRNSFSVPRISVCYACRPRCMAPFGVRLSGLLLGVERRGLSCGWAVCVPPAGSLECFAHVGDARGLLIFLLFVPESLACLSPR